MWSKTLIFLNTVITGTAIGALAVAPMTVYPHRNYHPFDRLRMGAFCGGAVATFGIATVYLFKEALGRNK
jgi:Ni/Fe-hydrogenase subunit HybB-like protein